jgi:hypothetical protein
MGAERLVADWSAPPADLDDWLDALTELAERTWPNPDQIGHHVLTEYVLPLLTGWRTDRAEVDRLTTELGEAKLDRGRLLAALAGCVVKATAYGTQRDPGCAEPFVAFYILPTGPIHRGISLLSDRGYASIRPRPGGPDSDTAWGDVVAERDAARAELAGMRQRVLALAGRMDAAAAALGITEETAGITASLRDAVGASPSGVTHRCPPDGSGTMPCCDRTPFEVPETDHITSDASLVTCPSPDAVTSTHRALIDLAEASRAATVGSSPAAVTTEEVSGRD